MCVHRVVTFVAGSPRTCAFSQDTNPPAGSPAAPRACSSQYVHRSARRQPAAVAALHTQRIGGIGSEGTSDGRMDGWMHGRTDEGPWLVMYSGPLVGSSPWWWFYVVVRRRRRSAESLYVRAYVCWPQPECDFSLAQKRSAAFCVQTSVQYKSLFGRIVSAAIHRCCRCRLP